LQSFRAWPTIEGNGEAEIEIRQVYELSDLGSAESMEPPAKLREPLSREIDLRGSIGLHCRARRA
jgi:hypothetical protein